MAKLRINGDSSGYVDLEAPNAASSRTVDVDQLPEKNVANTFSADMSFGDNNKVNLGTGNDLQLYHDGSNNYIKSAAAGWLNIPLSGHGMTVADGNFSNIFFKIDSSGRVTTPQQPAACVYPTGGTVASGDQTLLPFNVTLFNNGNHYNTTTKIFTAPVAGYYFASAQCRWATGEFVQNSYIRLFISKNDGNYNSTKIHVINGNNEAWSNYMAMSCSGVVQCSAGDNIRVKGGMSGGTSEIHGESSFNVYLLG